MKLNLDRLERAERITDADAVACARASLFAREEAKGILARINRLEKILKDKGYSLHGMVLTYPDRKTTRYVK